MCSWKCGRQKYFYKSNETFSLYPLKQGLILDVRKTSEGNKSDFLFQFMLRRITSFKKPLLCRSILQNPTFKLSSVYYAQLPQQICTTSIRLCIIRHFVQESVCLFKEQTLVAFSDSPRLQIRRPQ